MKIFIIILILSFSQIVHASNNTQKCYYKTPNGICITEEEVDVYNGIVTRVEYEQNKFLLLLHFDNTLIGTVANSLMLSNKLCNIAANISYIESESGEKIECK